MVETKLYKIVGVISKTEMWYLTPRDHCWTQKQGEAGLFTLDETYDVIEELDKKAAKADRESSIGKMKISATNVVGVRNMPEEEG
jgi:hypothetical protein